MNTVIEIFGVVSALVYLYLQVKQRWGMWIVGMISSLVFVYSLFTAKLYADSMLNVYYALASVYGMWCWRKGGAGNNTKDTIPVTCLTLWQGIIYAVIAAALFALMRFVLARWTDSPVPTGDAFTTALCIVGTYMLAKKFLEQWHVWIVANAVTVGLYFYKDLYLYAGLYIIYTIISFYGLWRWRRDMKRPPIPPLPCQRSA